MVNMPPTAIDISGGWATMQSPGLPRQMIVSQQNDSLTKKVDNFAVNRINQIRNHEAEVVQGVFITRNFLKTINHIPQVEGNLDVAIGSLGMVAAVGVVNCPFRVYHVSKELVESCQEEDQEGIGIGVVSLTEALGDGLDSTIVFNFSISNLVETFTVSEPVQALALPLAMALTTVGMMTKSFKMFRTRQLLSAIEEYEKASQSEEKLMNKVLGFSQEDFKLNFQNELKESAKNYQKTHHVGMSKLKGKKIEAVAKIDRKKERRTLRCTSDKVVACMKTIKNGDKQKIQDIKTYAQRKMKVGFASLTTSLVTLVALGILFFPVAPYIPIAILTVLGLIKLGIYIYENYFIYDGLKSFEPPAEKIDESILEKTCVIN